MTREFERKPEVKRMPVKPRLEVIAGSMFSGKTEEMIRRLRRAKVARQRIQVFKPAIDTRYGEETINSHSGFEWKALRLDHQKPKEILRFVKPETQVIAIDEAQFFGQGIVEVCKTLVAEGKRVIVAGLPTDFRNEPFGEMPALMAEAEKLDKLTAICTVCGEEGFFTQRIVDGKPAHYDDPIVVVGANELYEARCRKHHEVPGKSVKR
jgi:thymidine kinase